MRSQYRGLEPQDCCSFKRKTPELSLSSVQWEGHRKAQGEKKMAAWVKDLSRNTPVSLWIV
jgi:hypothetical protein